MAATNGGAAKPSATEATPFLGPGKPKPEAVQLQTEQELEANDDWTPKELSAEYWPTVWRNLSVMWPMLLGNLLEWYEFGSYGYVAEEITENFFSADWITWLFFAISFIMRPIGGLVYGLLGDRIGRKEATFWAIAGMSVATVGQGCLPSRYWGGEWGEDAGVYLLFLCRVMQGLSVGGGIGGVITYMCESSGRESLGQVNAFIAMTSNGAFAMSSMVVMVCRLSLGDEEMLHWGWRIPFWIAAIPAYICLTRLHELPESDDFKSGAGEKLAPPTALESLADMRRVFLVHKREVLLVMAITSSVAALWYVGPVYGATYVSQHGGSKVVATGASMLSQILAVVLAIPVGYLTDMYGLGKVCTLGNGVILVSGLPAFMWLAARATDNLDVWFDLGILMGSVQALAGTVIYLLACEFFPTSVRNAAVGLSYNLSVGLFGGCGPLFCSSLKHWDLFPGYYLSGCGLLGTGAMLYARWLRRQGLLCATHLRPHPF